MGKRTVGAGSAEALLDVALRNPYDAATTWRLRDLEQDGLVPSDAEGWRQWWTSLPEHLRSDEAAVTVLLVGLWRQARDDAPALDPRLARGVRGELFADCAEVACRSIAVRRQLDEIAGDSNAMREVRRTCWAAAFGERLDTVRGRERLFQTTPVMIHGETGTGKELVARALSASMKGTWSREHGWKRANAEAVHLASLPSELVQSALFGHEKGAYSGANTARVGVLERCHDGVVFLDEVAELPPETQVALLRTLQEGKARRLGADEDSNAAPRIISATHQDLEALVSRNAFRLDLLYRLSSVVIRIPPLRDRLEDLDRLAEKEIKQLAAPAARAELRDRFDAFRLTHRDYDWPGNVRELHAVVRTLALGLTPNLRRIAPTGTPFDTPKELEDATWSLQDVQRWYCGRVAKLTKNQTEAAERLGIDRGTLRRHLKEARHV